MKIKIYNFENGNYYYKEKNLKSMFGKWDKMSKSQSRLHGRPEYLVFPFTVSSYHFRGGSHDIILLAIDH
tara:strand:+ start:183 stop:392 length:210 start_codon:yes stop_codon:yes gene_type:complete